MFEIAVALRRLRRAPKLAVLAIGTLAAGMSVALLGFSLLASALFRPPPGVEAARDLMRVLVAEDRDTPSPWKYAMVVSFDQFTTLEQSLEGLLELAAYAPVDVSLEMGQSVNAATVSSRYFSLLGVKSPTGTRALTWDPDDGLQGVVVSGRLLRKLDGDHWASRASLVVNGVDLPIVGIADPAFAGLEPPVLDLWIPFATAASLPGVASIPRYGSSVHALSVIGQRRDGVSERQIDEALARAAMTLARMERRGDVSFRVFRASLLSPRGGIATPVAQQLPTILLGLGVVVLAIAIANLAGLQLSQAIERRRELAVRVALGARPGDLLRVQFAETGAIAVGAAAVSLAGVWVFRPMIGRIIPTLHSNPIDWRLVSVTLGVMIVSAAVAALTPVLYAVSQGGRPELHESAYSRSSSNWHRVQLGLQAALTIVLVVVAATLLASARAVQAVALGFDEEGLLVGRLELLEPARTAGGSDSRSIPATPPLSLARLLALRDSLRQLPGVLRASVASGAPAGRLGAMVVSSRKASGDPLGPRVLGAILNAVDDEFFATAGLRIVRGRSFTTAETDRALSVAIISSTTSRELFGDSDPIGECVTLGSSGSAIDCSVVVGVVEDAKYLSIVEPPQPTLYVPLGRTIPLNAAAIYVRHHPSTSIPDGSVIRIMRTADARPMVTTVQTFRSLVAPQTARFRLGAAAATMLSVAGLVILTTGLAAHLRMVFAVRQREIGIRIALGAQPRHVGHFVARDLLVGIAFGVGLGAVLAYAAVRHVRPLLHGVTTMTFWSFAIGVLAVASIAIVSVGWPALRATRVPPLDSLR